MITGLDRPHPEAEQHNHEQWKSGACRPCCEAEQAAERKRHITKQPADCSHQQFTAQVSVSRLEDIGRFVADVAVWCLDCGLPFSFTGFPVGISIDRPTLSIDATEARLPLDVPRRRES
jgi:hypothetical protein